MVIQLFIKDKLAREAKIKDNEFGHYYAQYKKIVERRGDDPWEIFVVRPVKLIGSKISRPLQQAWEQWLIRVENFKVNKQWDTQNK